MFPIRVSPETVYIVNSGLFLIIAGSTSVKLVPPSPSLINRAKPRIPQPPFD